MGVLELNLLCAVETFEFSLASAWWSCEDPISSVRYRGCLVKMRHARILFFRNLVIKCDEVGGYRGILLVEMLSVSILLVGWLQLVISWYRIGRGGYC
ncbi:hypothetical protein TIFTF001_055809 [Ficus carica]|uniref:Transmembrane protein n=1 Tax=Ficus carica TaxID=3494 RepID=A0AA88JJA5_FICCA|nr:hypothetical protein TIFTF001_055809 [Ficus carica]